MGKKRNLQNGGFRDSSLTHHSPWNIGINYVEHSFPLDEPGSDSDSVNSSAESLTCGLIEDRACGAPEGPNKPSGFFVNFHTTPLFLTTSKTNFHV
jgi:hypothetical protein